jgi:hypothetical protein
LCFRSSTSTSRSNQFSPELHSMLFRNCVMKLRVFKREPVPCKILFSLWWCTRVVWSIGWKRNFEFAWDCCLDVQTVSNDIYASFLVSYSVEFYCYQSMLRSFGTLVFSVVCAEPPLTYIISALPKLAPAQ